MYGMHWAHFSVRSTYTKVSAVTAIPINVGGFGSREMLYAYFLGEMLRQSEAVALSLLVYMCQLVTSMIGAAVYIGSQRRMSTVEEEGTEDD